MTHGNKSTEERGARPDLQAQGRRKPRGVSRGRQGREEGSGLRRSPGPLTTGFVGEPQRNDPAPTPRRALVKEAKGQ